MNEQRVSIPARCARRQASSRWATPARQEGDWSASVDVAGRLVIMLTGTSGHQAAISYRDALLAVRARRSDPTPITEAEAQQHAHAMLTNWMQLRGALLP